MQTGKNAAASMKETAGNIAASAKSGMDKTKATMQEKVERMTAHDPLEKEMATQRKEEKKTEAELNKQEARMQNAAAKQATAAGGAGGVTTTHSTTTGTTGHSTGLHQPSAMPGHGTGQPTGGHVTKGVVGSHPIGTNTATGGTTARTTRDTGYGTGGTFS